MHFDFASKMFRKQLQIHDAHAKIAAKFDIIHTILEVSINSQSEYLWTLSLVNFHLNEQNFIKCSQCQLTNFYKNGKWNAQLIS